MMKQEMRTVKYNAELKVEAYHFQGIMQKFPNHFHEYYVIGYIEQGQRFLSCKNKEYTIEPGDLLLFNPAIITLANRLTAERWIIAALIFNRKL